MDTEFADEEDEVKMSNKVDEKQILQIISNYFIEFTNGVSQKINIELEDSKKYVYGLEE